MAKHKILIIEDSAPMAETIAAYVDDGSREIHIAYNGQTGLEAVESFRPDCLLLDIRLPDMTGLEILEHLRQNGWHGGILIITGDASINIAVLAMQNGADDFVAKPVHPERLNVSLKNVLEKKRLENIVHSFETTKRTNFEGFIGASPEMQTVYRILENAAASTAPVFITGESGTGKELAAQAVHNLSPRKSKPFEAINCAAIPHNLLESEIFGHVKGAFTGATETREGMASRANGGTLFLDELGEMPIDLQPKLLRFIQTGVFTPVGGTTGQKVNVRFVSATNRDPLTLIEGNTLREDIYYRLNVIPVTLPPLRDRGADILQLAQLFLERHNREEQREFRTIEDAARDLLKSYDWPGNVRQLDNIIRQAVIMNRGEELTAEMLLPMLDRRAGRTTKTPEQAALAQSPFIHKPHTADEIQPMDDYERLIIEAALNACRGNLSEAARHLKINPSTIYRKQQKWYS